MAKMYYEKDCDINYLDGKKITIIGYGSQGHAHAMNLKDSGCDVCVGLREGSKNWANAEKAGLKVMTVAEAAKWGDIVMMLINDEVQADVYKKDIAPNLTAGNMLMFAHGFNIHFKQIVPPAGVDVAMIAPKGPGHTVRSQYVAGKGVPCLIAVEQNATGDAYKLGLAYAAGIGGARGGVMETTFQDETETDLFGEQAVLCGGVVELMKLARERGAGTVLITRFPKSPGAALADIVLECGAKEGPLQMGSIAARMGQLYLTDVLFNEMCRRDMEGCRERRRMVADALADKHL